MKKLIEYLKTIMEPDEIIINIIAIVVIIILAVVAAIYIPKLKTSLDKSDNTEPIMTSCEINPEITRNKTKTA